jgi:hypothetical protein
MEANLGKNPKHKRVQNENPNVEKIVILEKTKEKTIKTPFSKQNIFIPQ